MELPSMPDPSDYGDCEGPRYLAALASWERVCSVVADAEVKIAEANSKGKKCCIGCCGCDGD